MTEHNAEDRRVMALIVRALETMDAALGVPYGNVPLRTRIEAWLPACKGLPDEAIRFATQVACRDFEKYPVPAQFRKLAQGSPAYQAVVEKRRDHVPEPTAPERCDECGEPRAWHRILLFPDAPRPVAMRIVRHREECPQALRDALPSWWVDPPLFGVVQVDEETWRTIDPQWEPRARASSRESRPPVTLTVSDAERADRARQIREAAAREGGR